MIIGLARSLITWLNILKTVKLSSKLIESNRERANFSVRNLLISMSSMAMVPAKDILLEEPLITLMPSLP